MKVGIIGCGEIAIRHISFIRSIANANIVGIADKNTIQLEQFSKRYQIPNCYKNLTEMINSGKVDVLHILTPPFSHKKIALEAVRNGIHVYIEKPIALTLEEAREIYDEARKNNIKVCVGANFMFDPCVLKAIEEINKPGFGKVIYIEYFYSNDIRRYDRRKTTKDNEIHWSYYLPGGFHQNYISHPLYMLTKFIGKHQNIYVVCKNSGMLPQDLTDEIRVMIEGENIIGLLALSYSCEPYQHYIKIFGEKQTIKIDVRNYTTTFFKTNRLPKSITRIFYNNLNEAFQLSVATISNVWNFITGKLVPYQGMRILIKMFYDSIKKDLESPVPPDLVLNAEEIAEKIWNQCHNLHLDFNPRPNAQKNIKYKEKVLVTGASGFLGIHTVRRLVAEGYRVRAFVRKLSNIRKLEELGVEIFFGDIRHYDSFKKAVEGNDIIVHLAAAMNVPHNEYVEITVEGVKNLINLTRDLNISKAIYISSMCVYDRKSCKENQVLTEEHILERLPEERGAYTLSKVQAEKLVLEELHTAKTKWTILRPAIIFGEKNVPLKQIGGLSIGSKMRLIFGSGKNKLRLVHVEDVVKAIILSIKNNKYDGEIYNIVSDNLVSRREYLTHFYNQGLNIYIPYFIIYLLVYFQEIICAVLKRKPYLTRYRLMASQKNLNFDSTKIKTDLGWKPKCSLY